MRHNKKVRLCQPGVVECKVEFFVVKKMLSLGTSAAMAVVGVVAERGAAGESWSCPLQNHMESFDFLMDRVVTTMEIEAAEVSWKWKET